MLILPFFLASDASLDEERFPVAAVAALDQSRVFHDDRTGGYLIWAEGPDRQVFIDDRAELYRERLAEFVAVRDGDQPFGPLFERDGIEQALLKVTEPLVADLKAAGWDAGVRGRGICRSQASRSVVPCPGDHRPLPRLRLPGGRSRPHPPGSEGRGHHRDDHPSARRRPCARSWKQAELDLDRGVVGDNWRSRGDEFGDDPAYLETQVTLMNARVIGLVAQSRDRWGLAGDQFYVDFDLSWENVPPGTRLQLGTAVVERSEVPHTGCAKFSGRFGAEALRFVNTGVGRDLSFRGINTRVVVPGIVRRGDQITKL